MTSPSPSRPTLTGLTALALVLAVAAPAQAGGVRISPNRLEAVVDDGSRLPRIKLENTGDAPLRIDVNARPAKQGLDGLPVYDTSERALAAGWRRLRPSPASLVLGPGERRSVTAVVRGTSHIPGRYGVLLFTVRPADARPGARVSSAVRLATNVLLRFPGRATTSGDVSRAWAEQGPEPRTLRFVARLSSTGNVHTYGGARLTVRDAAGAVVARGRFPREVVLPSAARELELLVREVLPAGRYTARVDASVGGTASRRSFPFTLVGPNELPTARLEIARLERPDVEPGSPYDVEMTVRNTGTAPVRPGAALELRQPGGSKVTEALVDLPAIRPGEAVERTVEMPGVARGAYELDLRVRDGDRVLDERRVAFDTEAAVSRWDRLRDWLAAHVGVVLVLAVVSIVLVAGAGVALALRLARRRRPTYS